MECYSPRTSVLIGLGLLVPLWVAAQTEPPPSRGMLLVANKGNQTLGIVDPEAGREVAEIPEGGNYGPRSGRLTRGTDGLCPDLWELRRRQAGH